MSSVGNLLAGHSQRGASFSNADGVTGCWGSMKEVVQASAVMPSRFVLRDSLIVATVR